MAAPFYTIYDTALGILRRVAATALGGVGNEEKVVSTNTSGVLDISFFPAGIGADTVVAQASEAISAGAPINFHIVSGAVRVRNADGSVANGGKKCHGFAIAAIASGAAGTLYRNGYNTGVTGLTPGAEYWLGTSAGTYTVTPPSTTGQTSQYLGVAFSATALDVQPGPAIGL